MIQFFGSRSGSTSRYRSNRLGAQSSTRATQGVLHLCNSCLFSPARLSLLAQDVCFNGLTATSLACNSLILRQFGEYFVSRYCTFAHSIISKFKIRVQPSRPGNSRAGENFPRTVSQIAISTLLACTLVVQTGCLIAYRAAALPRAIIRPIPHFSTPAWWSPCSGAAFQEPAPHENPPPVHRLTPLRHVARSGNSVILALF